VIVHLLRCLPRVTAIAGALMVVLLPLVARAGSAGAPVSTGRLGLCDVLPGVAPSGQSWNALAFAAGARLNRWEIRWDSVEPAPGVFNFTADDAAVQQSIAAGLQVVGILIGTPAWAGHAGNGVPRGLDRPLHDPQNLWAQYVLTTVAHYRGQVSDWEVWNEPDMRFFWRGTPDQYARLLQVTYRAVKDADPAARVLMGGMVVPDLGFLTRVLHDAAKEAGGHGPIFDAVSWHAYGPAHLLYTNIRRVRAVLDATGFGRTPIWVTEAGFPSANPNGTPRQAAYVLQSITYALAAGAQRVLVYRASDDATGKGWGLLDSQGTQRPSYLAFEVAADSLDDSGPIVYAPDSHVERFTFYEPGRRVTVLWSHGIADQHVTLPAAGPQASLMDWQGEGSVIDGAAGSYQLTVPGATYNAGVDPSGSVVGGPPVLLTEPNSLPSSLAGQAYVTGSGTLALLNAGSEPAAVAVSLPANPAVHDVVEVPPATLRVVLLPLLGGPGYHGGYLVSATRPITVQPSLSAPPATEWYSAGGVPLAILNPARRPVRLSLTTYRSGHPSSLSMTIPPLANRTLSGLPAAVIRSSEPVVVRGAVPHLSASWYQLQPGHGGLSLFNPSPHSASVNVRFVGAPTVVGQQLRLRPGRVFRLEPHGARAVVIQSGVPLAASPAVAAARTETSVAADGPINAVTLFNPSDQPAHVNYSVVTASRTVQKAVVVGPSRLSRVAVRVAGSGPSGVIVHSDLPVVAVPAS